jgi:hypothetical protein
VQFLWSKCVARLFFFNYFFVVFILLLCKNTSLSIYHVFLLPPLPCCFVTFNLFSFSFFLSFSKGEKQGYRSLEGSNKTSLLKDTNQVCFKVKLHLLKNWYCQIVLNTPKYPFIQQTKESDMFNIRPHKIKYDRGQRKKI